MSDNFKTKFWEYPWYAFVTLFLLCVGLVLGVFWILGRALRLMGRPAISLRFALTTALVAAALIGSYVYYRYTHTLDLGKTEVVLVVKPGEHFSSIVDRLYTQRVIDSKLLLKYPARWMKLDTRIIPGEYRFTGQNSAQSVLRRLARGEGVQVRLTVIEGLPIWRVAGELKQQLGIDSSSVMGMAKDTGLARSLGVPSLEGYLFPETYLFAPGTDARTVLIAMARMTLAKTSGVWNDTASVGLTRSQVMILASIVQAETGRLEEAPRVASVYLNRLRRGMNLDADPTVIYGLGGLNRPLTKDDLETPTPYNTYRNLGLPPTPINSPGLAAIEAVLHPETTDYLYFVADGSGGHTFSKTNEEQNLARRRAKILQRLNHRS
jgi:UPF0755 protein